LTFDTKPGRLDLKEVLEDLWAPAGKFSHNPPQTVMQIAK